MPVRAKTTVACPKCGGLTGCKRTNERKVPSGSSFDRLRHCLSCGHRFYTLEVYATAIKKNIRDRPEIIPGQEFDSCARCSLTRRFTDRIAESIREWNT